MPLTEKGNEIKANMEKEYGEKKGEEVFYASRNKGTISGVDARFGGHPEFVKSADCALSHKDILGWKKP
jgi:hypothetical protein